MSKAHLILHWSPISALATLLLAASPGAAATYTWNGGGGTWDTSSNNWTPRGASRPWDLSDGSANIADFNTLNVAPVVSGTVYVNGIQFDNTANIQGGTINLVAGTLTTPTITVNASGGTIGSVIAGSAGFTIAGTGLLTLAGNNTYTGPTNINNGTLALSGTIAGGSTVYVGNGTAERYAATLSRNPARTAIPWSLTAAPYQPVRTLRIT